MNPLEIPELLTQVGRFLPLWVREPYYKGARHELAFRPKTFHACILVNKFWYSTLMPILWYNYNGSFHEKASLEYIHRQCHLFRTFRSHRGHEGPYDGCVNLLELNISAHGASRYTNGVDLQCQMDLVKANIGLRSLYWHGPLTRTYLPVGSLISFTNIRVMTLLGWDGSDGRLTKVLRSVAGTLTKLCLYSVRGIKSEDLFYMEDDDDDNGDYDDEDREEGEEKAGKGKGKIKRAGSIEAKERKLLILPHVTKLAYRINNTESTGLEDLVTCFPNLHKLSVHPEYEPKYYYLPRLTRNLQNHCPRLQVLTLKYSSHKESEYLILLRCCQTSGLVKLTLTIKDFGENFTNAIIAHAQTLEVLELSQNNEIFQSERCLRILVACRNLKTAIFSGHARINRQKFLDVLWSKPWGCQDLKVIEFSFIPEEGNPDPKKFRDFDLRSRKDRPSLDQAEKIITGQWYMHLRNEDDYDNKALYQNKLYLSIIFDNLKELKHLEMVKWNDILYERSPVRKYGFPKIK
ncbi:hypothetical protein BGZ46_004665 [Entomortierella lignicola]|nr:hypothetical protein BGZ46_004665 [Entomortierella lignicola]